MPTRFLSKTEAMAGDRWLVVDATDQVLGRLASRVATLLTGKQKSGYAPFLVTGDHVVVVNAAKIRLTGQKLDQKVYRRHTGYPGGLREIGARKMFETRPERMIEEAMLGMLPKNKLRKQMARRLRVYRGAEHPHAAQKPEALASPAQRRGGQIQ
jgi:large subunit ribosomal protein L13